MRQLARELLRRSRLMQAWPWAVLIVAVCAVGVAWWRAWEARPRPASAPGANLLATMDRWQAAVAQCRRQVEAHPKDPSARLQLAALLYEGGEASGAAAEMEAAARLAPDNATVRRNAGNFYAHLGNMALAVEHLQAAVSLSPTDLQAWLALADAHRARTELPESEAAMAKARQLAGDSAQAHVLLGQTLDEWSDPERAQQEFERALALDPSSAGANFERGRLALEGNDLDTAERYLQKAVGLAPDSGRCEYYLGLVFVRRPPTSGSLASARRHLERALELAGPHAGVFFALGGVCEREKKTQEAVEYFEKAVQLAPDYADACYSLAGACRRLGRTKDGEQHLARFRELKALQQATTRAEARASHEPRNAEAHYQLALVYEKQGSLISALAHLQKAKELDPKHRAAQEKFAQLYGKVGAVPHLAWTQ